LIVRIAAVPLFLLFQSVAITSSSSTVVQFRCVSLHFSFFFKEFTARVGFGYSIHSSGDPGPIPDRSWTDPPAMKLHWALLTLLVHSLNGLPVVDESGTGKEVIGVSTSQPEVTEAPEVTDAPEVPEVAAAEAGASADDVIVAEGIDDAILPVVTSPTLSPVDLIIENEIWQYRYPPFEDIVQSDEQLALAAAKGRSNKGAGLPDYVIGILNPSELIENIFRPVSDFFGGGLLLAPPPLPLATSPDVPDVADDSDVLFNARQDRWIWRG